MLASNGDKCNSVIDLFENKELITMCAPMVRYSKLVFENMGVNGALSLPMIVSHSFVESEKARHSDFTTAVVSLLVHCHLVNWQPGQSVTANKATSPIE
ncbi:tRNA-dihydrouridine(20a/20b) synthase like protein [Argiope bruennichi]|uniref:tRNA-dihydrouridine(20a/20b) synthase like protein n=1 Tax=Argiope bruennichi TaxID=94029 RepID=A0A8T0FHB6_ARGBR|nr:tRNA-dihydrouridine(20a/20b) synthase like protein [Argiope bruennichi]